MRRGENSRIWWLPQFLIQIPTSSERPHSPLEGFVGFYVAHLEARLRFPVSPFFAEVSALFKILLNQLVPKAFSVLVGFCILVRNLVEVPSAAQFQSFFMLKKASPSLFYFTSKGDAHFLLSYSSVKEWKRHYFFISPPTPRAFPIEWVSIAPDSPRYSTHTHPASFQTLKDRPNTLYFDPFELVHAALLFHYGLNPKEVVLDTTAVNMFNKLLQDKALGEGKVPGSSYKCPLPERPSLTPASSASTGDPKGKCHVEPMSPPAKKAKVSSGSFVQPTPKPATHASTPRPSPAQVKKKRLGVNERPFLLKEEDNSSWAADFVKGLLTSLDKGFLESLSRDQIMNMLAAYASNIVLLVGDLLKRGDPRAEEGQRKVEELEEDMHENERQYEASLAHLRSYEGKKKLEELWTSKLADLKKSEDFQRLHANSALRYYYHGYQTCAGQFPDIGYPPLTIPTDFLDIYIRLVDVPEPDEEVPSELLESLLHSPLKSEAPADPEDPQVENATPLQMVPPAGDDNSIPSVDK
ncbi:UNVERIFIED_CONTAM: hypothetical protein Scaly_2715100 [Sesamum calycinum]|uniref:Transposase (putative) gypsy type domain-containing protein n=1 Tax=Sesamum calycinum TaxID=2727403 RepID=A0AAW2J2U7_9LAMI